MTLHDERSVKEFVNVVGGLQMRVLAFPSPARSLDAIANSYQRVFQKEHAPADIVKQQFIVDGNLHWFVQDGKKYRLLVHESRQYRQGYQR